MTDDQDRERRPGMQLKRFSKSIATNGLAGSFVSIVLGAYIRLVERTTRWSRLGDEFAGPILLGEQGVLIALWHQRLMLAALLRRETSKRAFMLVSSHRDGEFLANAVRRYKIEYIRGSAANPKKTSKDKHGASAVALIIAALRDGHIVCVTPDGPRGPERKAQPGIIKLAQMSGAPILPVTIAASRGWFLKTWDRFLIPAPFSKGCFASGAPIRVPDEADPAGIEEARQTLEMALNDICAVADARVGLSPEPGAMV